MTAGISKNRKVKRVSAGQAVFCTMSVIALALTFKYSQSAIAAVSHGLELCVKTVIPSLFPFMVLSEIFVSSGAAGIVAKLIGKPFEYCFGISRNGASALVLGALCGFPIGTKCALSQRERGEINDRELLHLLCFCNGPSSAFLISAVGISLFGSKAFGIALYVAELLSAVVIGIIFRFVLKNETPEPSVQDTPEEPKKPGCTRTVVNAVRDSAEGMLYVCAFVVFFAVITGILEIYAEKFGISGTMKALSVGFFEMTGGVFAASELKRGAAYICTAFIVGWSGLSVHFQFISLCGNRRIKYGIYFCAKFLRGLLDAFFIIIISSAFGGSFAADPVGVQSFLPSAVIHPTNVISFFTFLCGIISIPLSRKR